MYFFSNQQSPKEPCPAESLSCQGCAVEDSSERSNIFGTDVGDAEHPQHCPLPSDRGISAKKKGFQNRNAIPTAFCVKENNWHNFPSIILEVKEELSLEFHLWVIK